MNRQTMIAVGLGVLAVVLVFWQLVPIFTGGPPPVPAAPLAAAPSAGASAALAVLDSRDPAEDSEAAATAYQQLIAQVDIERLTFERPDLRNPFRPLVGPGSEVSEQATLDDARRLAAGLMDDESFLERETLNLGYRVNGIIWTAGGPLTLLNGQVLGVGEDIEEGGTITAITADAVVFTYEGQSVTLLLQEEEI